MASDGVFRVGWRVLREHRADAVHADGHRRRTRVAGITAVVAGSLISISVAIWRWPITPLPVALVGVVFCAAAIGFLSCIFVRVGFEPADVPTEVLGDWRRAERIGKQFGPYPPALDPADRDIVLRRAESTRGPTIALAMRMAWLPVGWAAGIVGTLCLGGERLSIVALALPLLMGFLQSSTSIAAVNALGRAELARRRAEAAPVLPPAPPKTWPRGTRPSGSKTALPGE